MAKGRSGSLGIGLVTAQTLLCLGLLALGWRGVRDNPWLWPGLAAGVAVATAGVRAMRLSRLKLTPEPGEDAVLCEQGIYRHIRHPMYAGLLLAFGMIALAGGAWGGTAWGALFAVLWIKLRLEERYWTERSPAYRDYQGRTKRLLPGIW